MSMRRTLARATLITAIAGLAACGSSSSNSGGTSSTGGGSATGGSAGTGGSPGTGGHGTGGTGGMGATGGLPGTGGSAGSGTGGVGGTGGGGGTGGAAGSATGGSAGIDGGAGTAGSGTGGSAGSGTGGSAGSGTGGSAGIDGGAGTGGGAGSGTGGGTATGGAGGTGGTAGGSGAGGTGGTGGTGGSCSGGEKSCGGNCVDTQTDVNNCGSCYNICTSPAHAAADCKGGNCGYGCDLNYGDCDGKAANGCEADLRTDAKNCGTCGHDCLGGSCSGGACQQVTVYDATGVSHLKMDATNFYWDDGTHIYSMAKTGGPVTTLASGLVQVTATAIDSANVYWTDNSANKIGKVSKSGGKLTTLATCNSCYDVVTDGVNVYWRDTDSSNDELVRELPVNGGTAATLVSIPYSGSTYNSAYISKLAVDSSNVYLIEEREDVSNQIYTEIQSVPVGGGALKTLVAAQPGMGPSRGVAVQGGYLYWATQTYGSPPPPPGTKPGVFGVPTGGGAIVTVEDAGPVYGGSEMAVDSTYAYYYNWNDYSTAKAKLDGSSYYPTDIASASGDVRADAKFVYWGNSRGIYKVAK